MHALSAQVWFSASIAANLWSEIRVNQEIVLLGLLLLFFLALTLDTYSKNLRVVLIASPGRRSAATYRGEAGPTLDSKKLVTRGKPGGLQWQQGSLAMYLIVGCVGRGVGSDSENSCSLGGGAYPGSWTAQIPHRKALEG